MAAGILIVDDYTPNLVAMEAALEPLGEQVAKARSGAEALQYLADHDCELVVLDVHMPNLDGLETAARMRAEDRTRHLPIIFVTASHGENADAIRGYAQGAVDYVVRPIDPDVLRAKVASQLDLHRRREARSRAAAAATAEAERRRMYASLMHAPGAICSTRGPTHIFELVNDRFQEFLGDRQILGKPAREALSEISGDPIWGAVDDVFRTGEPFAAAEYAVHLAKRDSNEVEPRFFSVLIQARQDLAGAIDGLMIHGFEVSSQVRARGKERETVRMRNEFLALASHELRTPLTALTLQLQLLLRKEGGGEVSEAVRKALQQTERLGRLAADLVDVSRLTTGTLTLNRRPMDLGQLARRVVEFHRQKAEDAGCAVRVDTGQVMGTWDEERLEQVVTNLLVNAIKFGSGRPVEVCVTSTEDRARLTVRDEGIGIPERDQRRIFELFERATPANSYGGLGLGLFVAMQIVRAHGGDMTVESAPGRGSRFAFALPLSAFQTTL